MVVSDDRLASAFAAHLCLNHITFKVNAAGVHEFSFHDRDHSQAHNALAEAKKSLRLAAEMEQQA